MFQDVTNYQLTQKETSWPIRDCHAVFSSHPPKPAKTRVGYCTESWKQEGKRQFFFRDLLRINFDAERGERGD
jgi:hypothetical protein